MRLVARSYALHRPWIATMRVACAALLLVAAVSCAAAETVACSGDQDYVATEPVIDMNETACSQLRERAINTFCRGGQSGVAADYETLYTRDFERCSGEVAAAIPKFCRDAVENTSSTRFVCVKVPASAKRSITDDKASQRPKRSKSTDDDVGEPKFKGGDYQPIPGACRITGTC
jgi:hypothetical protein